MASPAISVSGLSKTYRVAQSADRPTTAAEALLHRIRHPRRRDAFQDFSALHDVSFDIPWGEAVGIVGRNGAGKSTLLKILTRITAPSTGRIELGGRIGSLLEIGTGFHPELTGRENIYLNGTLLGMRKKEIRRHFDEIVDFAGVERFLDTQVKRYSSGMYIRLAFAVAAHLDTELLAIDEVLAVGDADFQAKCLRKMRELVHSGRTVLLVSHQLQNVTALCTTALYLQEGGLMLHGSVDAAIDAYKRSFEPAATNKVDASRRPGSGELRFTHAQVLKEVCMPDDEKVIEFSVGANPDFMGRYYVSSHVRDADGVTVVHCDSRLMDFWLDAGRERHGRLIIRGPWLKPGSYTVDLFLCKTGVVDSWIGASMFEVLPVLPYPEASNVEASGRGVVLSDFTYTS